MTAYLSEVTPRVPNALSCVSNLSYSQHKAMFPLCRVACCDTRLSSSRTFTSLLIIIYNFFSSSTYLRLVRVKQTTDNTFCMFFVSRLLSCLLFWNALFLNFSHIIQQNTTIRTINTSFSRFSIPCCGRQHYFIVNVNKLSYETTNVLWVIGLFKISRSQPMKLFALQTVDILNPDAIKKLLVCLSNTVVTLSVFNFIGRNNYQPHHQSIKIT